jgi:hypothetical protein
MLYREAVAADAAVDSSVKAVVYRVGDGEPSMAKQCSTKNE